MSAAYTFSPPIVLAPRMLLHICEVIAIPLVMLESLNDCVNALSLIVE